LNKELGEKQQIRDTYEEYALTYEELEEYRHAYLAHKLFVMYKDSVLNEAMDRDIRNKNEVNNFKFFNERIALIEGKTRMERTIAIGASAAFVLMLAFSFFLYSANKTKSRINEQLRATQNQLVVQEKLASLGQLTAG